jgi:hypothetical protein
MPEPRDLHRGSTRLLSTIMIALGAAMVVSTVAHGGGAAAIGVVLGILFIAAGGARLYLLSKTGRS